MPDPNLQTVTDEVIAVLKRHDLAGVVTLASPTHAHYALHVAPSWSLARLEDDAEGRTHLRVRCHREHFTSPEAQREALATTVGMLVGLLDAGRFTHEQLERVVSLLGRHVEIAHVSQREDV